MHLRLLGPLEVALEPDADAQVVRLGGPRQRAVLAVLALAAPSVVSTDRLVDAIWGEEPPADPLGTLQVFVSKLRRALAAQGLTDVIESQTPGYRLAAAVSDTDVARFEALTARAGQLRDSDPGAALAAYDEALGLWRGPLLSDLVGLPFVVAEAARLEEMRLLAVEQRTEAALLLGRDAELVAGLEELVRLHPTREALWGHLMTALYRSDRQADALHAYGRARAQLAEELGIDPGTALRQLELAVLRQDPDLAAPTPSPDTSRPPHPSALEVAAAPEPRLAARVPRVNTTTYGRDALVDDVLARLDAARLVTLTGMGGSGKSRLATVVAQRLQDAGGGVVFLPVTEATTVERLHTDIASALESGGGRHPLEPLADRHEVVVLDNLEAMPDAAAAVALLVERTALTLLVTTRVSLGLLVEEELPVPPLAVPAPGASTAEIAGAPAVSMFVDRAGAAARASGRTFALPGHEEEVARLCRLLDGLPLALELAAARVKLLGLDQLLAQLPRSLAILTTSATDVPERHRALDRTIEWSYLRLDEETRLMCDRLALFEGGFTLDALEAVCPDVPNVLDLVAAISDARLVTAVESRVEVRFAMLGTVRAFAHRRLTDHPDLDVRRQRLAQHLATLVETWSTEANGPEGMLALGRFADGAADVEGAITHALQRGALPDAVRLVRGSVELWVASGRLAIGSELVAGALAEAPDDPYLALAAGQLAYHLTDWDGARARCEQALALADPDDAVLRATASCYVAGSLAIAGDVEEAAVWADRALALAEEHDLYPQVAVALAMRAITFGVRGQFDEEAESHLRRLEVVRARGDITRISDTLNTLAEIALDEDDVETAASYAAEAQTMAGTSRVPEARDARITLARALVARGDAPGASLLLAEAMPLVDRTGQRLARAQCLRVAGAVASLIGRPDDAVRLFASAEAVSPSPGGSVDPVERDLAAALAAARNDLDGPAASRAWMLGGLASEVSARSLLTDVLTHARGNGAVPEDGSASGQTPGGQAQSSRIP